MSFQWIIDNAVDIQINKRGVVAQTMSRDQSIRTVSRGGKIWRFVVTPSPGTKWQNIRQYIETLDQLDRLSPANINFNNAAIDYIFGYQGSQSSTSGWTATVTQGSANIVVSGSAPTAPYRFKAGDLIQIGSGHVYTSTGNVANSSGNVILNRPVLETSGSHSITVGRACTFNVICTDMPDYKITPLGFVEWSGPFTFVETLV
jgi:hypothetical protein